MKIQDAEQCPCKSGLTFGECHGERIRERLANTRHIRMTVIPEPDPGTRDILHLFEAAAPGFSGFGGMDTLHCGKCDASVMIGVDHGSIKGHLLVRCLTCFAVNQT